MAHFINSKLFIIFVVNQNIDILTFKPVSRVVVIAVPYRKQVQHVHQLSGKM